MIASVRITEVSGINETIIHFNKKQQTSGNDHHIQLFHPPGNPFPVLGNRRPIPHFLRCTKSGAFPEFRKK
ncbi:unnamed protein product [Allacma fusca]|uniref:Uncharacterized protein n=1 Tax=Allacma fusca TaxID=39272 RepID=A0A8J2L5R0_9HEXA|nr:unnamed protein product [Allacma fusca]